MRHPASDSDDTPSVHTRRLVWGTAHTGTGLNQTSPVFTRTPFHYVVSSVTSVKPYHVDSRRDTA